MVKNSQPEVPQWVRDRLPPDRRAAIDFLRFFVDEEMLRDIAHADYGRDVEQHLAALRPLWSGEHFEALQWFPKEVMELVRWLEPDHQTDSVKLEIHRMRAFCCAVLLAATNHYSPWNATLIQFLNSVFLLGAEAIEASGRFLLWWIENESEGVEDRPFFVLAIAAVLLELEPRMPIVMEESLVKWILDEEAAERENQNEMLPDYPDSTWLFGLSICDTMISRWKELISRLIDERKNHPLGEMLASKLPGL